MDKTLLIFSFACDAVQLNEASTCNTLHLTATERPRLERHAGAHGWLLGHT